MGRFIDRTVVVTGAAQGIGAACAAAPAGEGANVVVGDRDVAAGKAKAGVNSLTQQLAVELGGNGIRVSAIAPGPIDTEATRTVPPGSIVDDMVERLPLARMGTPADLVGGCRYLLSDEASRVTGQLFDIDGGRIIRS